MAQRWRELREAYPRIVTGIVLAIAVLLLADLGLAYNRIHYGRELARMRAAMTETERRRVDAMAASEGSHLALAAELLRRQALGDEELHLGVDTKNNLLYLERQGARLREMCVRLGRDATVGTPPDTVLLAAPLGKRLVARVADGSYAWAVPGWVYVDRGWPVPDDRQIPGALGPLVIFLDSGAVLYARPAVGPLSDVNLSRVSSTARRGSSSSGSCWLSPWPAPRFSSTPWACASGATWPAWYCTTQRRYPGVLGTHRLNMGNGYAIHGTNQPKTVGRAVSHGCVRLRNEDIAKLYAMVPVGTPVYIY